MAPALQLVKDTGLGKSWQIMEELQKEGKTKSIGVSNYRVSDLEEVLKVAKVRFSRYPIPGLAQLIHHCRLRSRHPSTRYAGLGDLTQHTADS